MPDFDRMMYQTPFWSSATMGRDIYAPHRESVTSGQVDRWVLPEFDSGEGGWPAHYTQPAPPDPYLRQQGFQQTGIFGGPAGRAELYRGPQTPPIGVPIGFDPGVHGLGRAPRRGRARWEALRAARRAKQLRRSRLTPKRGMGDLSGIGAIAGVAGAAVLIFLGIEAIHILAEAKGEQIRGRKEDRR